MSKIINGSEISKQIRKELKEEVGSLYEKYNKRPGLAVVIVGDDPASHSYVNMKHKACNKIGVHSELHKMPESSSQEEVLEKVKELNEDENINGILVQVPLPKGIDENLINANIKPEKDVDGFHAMNMGNLTLGTPVYEPCTPLGIMELIDKTGIDLEGKKAVVVGRSNILGKPLSIMLLNKSATVTVCHSRTKDLKKETLEADILIAAVGKPKMITEDMIKPGTVVIDAGTSKVDGVLVGDVDYEKVYEKSSYITPVPGGVGPMTIAMLLKNTIKAFKEQWS